MPEAYRRVILKPPGLSADASAQLRQRLGIAVDAQRQLAVDSPHVLRFVGKLQEDERAFTVEHEPARALDAASLFDPKAPPADETLLLRVAAALADALRVAHGGEHRDRIVHGGLCAGVVLETPHGVHKITDFGFAPAVCTALDIGAYVELAVGPGDLGSSPVPGTGVWEVLSPDEATRDDRLCGFIDPEKYGSQALNTFEAGSDIIAAGILLHLLAEHRHPMIEDPDGHRMVVLAESMAFWPYNGARRKSLRESSDPAVQCWCDVVARMLARLPKDRPTARDVVASFAAVGIKPVDAGEMLRRRLDTIVPLIRNRQWDEARQALSAIASAEGAPDDVAERANALRQEVEAHLLLAEAQDRFKSDDWTTTQDSLDRLTALSTIPAEVAQHADKLAARLRHNVEVQEELDRAERAVRETAAADPQRALTEARAAIDRAARRLDDKDLVAPLRARGEQFRQRLQAECERLEAAVEEHQARLARAREWLERLKKAWEQEHLVEVGQLLRDRPDELHWSDAIRTQTQQIETQYAEIQKVPPWIERLRDAVDAGRLPDAEKVLAQKPKLTHWPATLGNQVEDLAERLRIAKVQAAQHAHAKEWIRRVDGAVSRGDWTAAARELAAKPTLDHWPEEVVEQEQGLRPQVDEQLAEIERERLEIEETNRKTAAWLETAEQAARKESWAEAIDILRVPPLDTDRLPAEARRTADERIRLYQQSLEEARRKLRERQTQAVHDLALTFVRDAIRQELAGLLAPELAEVMVDAVEWNSLETPTAGMARLTVHVRGLTDRPGDEPITSAFEFDLVEKPPRLGDDDGSVRATIRDALVTRIARLQAGRADELMTTWRHGLFPHAEWEIKLKEPAQRADAALHLLGKAEPSSRMETALGWDPRALAWTFDDLTAVVRHALDLVYRAARDIVRAKALETAGTLRPHAAIISVDVDPPSLPVPAIVPASLMLRCRLSVRLPGRTDRQPLLDFSAACPKVGQVVIRDSLRPAEQRFEELLVERQNELRSRIEGDLKAYAKAAPAKLKVASLTGRIKRPVEELRFELRPKKGDRVALATPWNPGTFEFELPGSLHAWLADALGDRPAPVERAKRDAPPVEQKDGAKAAPPWRKVPARAFVLTAVAAVLGVAVVVPILHSTTDQTTSRRSPDEALGAVRAIFDTSPYLAPYIDSLMRAGEQQDGRLAVTCVLPGLPQPERTLALSLSREVPPISDEDRTVLEDDIRSLDTLLSNPEASFGRTVSQGLGSVFASTPFFDLDRVRVRLGPRLEWTLSDAAGNVWRAVDVAVDLHLYGRAATGPDSVEGVAATDAGEVQLAGLTTDLVVADGEIRAEGRKFVDDVVRQICQTQVLAQSESLAQRCRELVGGAKVPGVEVGTGSEPPTAEQRSPDEALAAVRAILGASPYLTPQIDTLVTAGEQQGGQLVVTCLLPGSREPERVLTLSLSREHSPVSEEDRTALESDIRALTTLLSDPEPSFERSVRQALRPTFASTPYLNLNRIRARLESSPEWMLDAERHSWRAVDVDVKIMYAKVAPDNDSTSESVGPPEAMETLLAETNTDLAIADGEIRADRREFADDTAGQIGDALVRIQGDSLAQRREQLLRGVEMLGARVGEDAWTTSNLRTAATVRLEVPRLLPRLIDLQWDRDRLAFVSETWEQTTAQLAQAASVLGVIDQALTAGDHWLRAAILDPTTALSPTELREPTTDGVWVFGVPAPWPASAETAPNPLPVRVVTTDEVASLERPVYWPLIERYADFASGPVFLDDPESLRVLSQDLNAAVTAVAGAGLTQLTALMTELAEPGRRIVPRFELIQEEEPVLSGADVDAVLSNAGSAASLSIAGRVRFGVKLSPEPQNDPLAPFGPPFLGALDTALANLTIAKEGAVPACTLTLSPHPAEPTGVTERWSDVQEVASGLIVTFAEVRQLNRLLRTLPHRDAVEQELEGTLGGAEQVPVDGDRAYALLKDIWSAKGQVPRGPEGFVEFSEDRQRQFKRAFSRPKRRIGPTVFIEYFSGPRWTYAVVWSIKREGLSFPGDTLQEGPTLVRVCPTSQFYEGGAGQLSGALGGVLFDGVLGQIPKAVAADTPSFGKHVGLVVAYDDRMALANLPALTFSAQRSLVEPADLNTPLPEDTQLEWTSLSTLRESEWAADYALTGALSDVSGSFALIQDARAWAITAVDEAMRSAPAPVP